MHRLKTDGRMQLPLQSFIQNALNNLARKTAADPNRRNYLMTNPLEVSVNIAPNEYNYFADLAGLIDDPQIMLDYLRSGTIFWLPATTTFVPSDVDVSASTVTLSTATYTTGQAVRISVGVGALLPAPLVEGATYYIIGTKGGALIQFAASATDASNGDFIPFTDAGKGTNTITPYFKQICQWLASPTQGSLEQCLPFDYTYIWLEDGDLYTNRNSGTFQFNVPFIPTLDSLPEALESDLLDEVVNIAITSGFEAQTEAQR